MRYFALILSLFFSNLILAQRIFKKFSYPYAQENFEIENEFWPIQQNSFDNASIENGQYQLIRKAENGFSVFTNDSISSLSNFELITQMELIDDKKQFSLNGLTFSQKYSSAGIVVHANDKDQSALIIEFHSKKGFRLLQLSNKKLSKFSNKSNDGWVSCKSLKTAGFHEIRLRSFKNVFDLYIDNKYQTSFIDKLNESGQIGFFVGAESAISIESLEINLMQEEKLKKEETKEEDPQLFELIKLLRTKVNNHRAENLALKRELVGYQNIAIQDTINSGKLKRLLNKFEIKELEIRDLNMQLEEQQRRLNYLEAMKVEIESNQDGDMVMNLMEVLNKEKNKNNEAQIEIQKLKKENQELTKKIMELLQESNN